jgi:hypothetical protein
MPFKVFFNDALDFHNIFGKVKVKLGRESTGKAVIKKGGG